MWVLRYTSKYQRMKAVGENASHIHNYCRSQLFALNERWYIWGNDEELYAHADSWHAVAVSAIRLCAVTPPIKPRPDSILLHVAYQ